MNTSDRAAKAWTKPQLAKLGTLKDVAAKSITQQDGASTNYNFGAAS